MGSTFSKRSQDLQDSKPSTSHAGYVRLEEFQPLFHFVGILKGISSSLIKIAVKCTPINLSQRERYEFRVLEGRKEDILREIRLFANSLYMHVRNMKRLIELNPTMPCKLQFQDIPYRASKVPVKDLLSKYAHDCKILAADYKDFSDKLSMKHGDSASAKKMIGTLFIISGVLIAAALVFFTVGAALPVVASVGVVVGAGVMTIGAAMLTDTEVERARDYLNGVGADLTKIYLKLDSASDYCNETMHELVIANIDDVLNLTDELCCDIEASIVAKFVYSSKDPSRGFKRSVSMPLI